MMLPDVLKQLGLFGIGVTAIGWLIRTIIVHWLDRDVAKYRSDLHSARDVEMERLRNDLRIRSIEHEIRFRSIHERQAEVLAETYSCLYKLNKAVASYIAILEHQGDPSKEEKLKVVSQMHDKFQSYFNPRKIFFPKTLGDRVMSVANKFAEIANIFTRGQQREQRGSYSPPDEPDHWQKAYDRMKDEVPPLLEQLEQGFQRLLGVTELCPNDSEQRPEEAQH